MALGALGRYALRAGLRAPTRGSVADAARARAPRVGPAASARSRARGRARGRAGSGNPCVARVSTHRGSCARACGHEMGGACVGGVGGSRVSLGRRVGWGACGVARAARWDRRGRPGARTCRARASTRDAVGAPGGEGVRARYTASIVALLRAAGACGSHLSARVAAALLRASGADWTALRCRMRCRAALLWVRHGAGGAGGARRPRFSRCFAQLVARDHTYPSQAAPPPRAPSGPT